MTNQPPPLPDPGTPSDPGWPTPWPLVIATAALIISITALILAIA